MTLKVSIYPNEKQNVMIHLNFGYNRFVWNQMLSMLIERYPNTPQVSFLNAYALNLLLRALKNEVPWLKNAESTNLQATNHDLMAVKFF